MVDYGFYLSEFSGRSIPEEDFSYYANRAFDRISAYTLNRAEEDCEETYLAVCAVADIMYETEGRCGLSSESADGYSANYQDISSLLYSTAQGYIPSTLFYRGVIE